MSRAIELLAVVAVQAGLEAEEAGLAFFRIELMNTSPAFIRALADVARRYDRGVDKTVLDWEYLLVTARKR